MWRSTVDKMARARAGAPEVGGGVKACACLCWPVTEFAMAGDTPSLGDPVPSEDPRSCARIRKEGEAMLRNAVILAAFRDDGLPAAFLHLCRPLPAAGYGVGHCILATAPGLGRDRISS